MKGTDSQDELLAELRRADPVDADSLEAGSDPGPARLLQTILADTADGPQQVRAADRQLRSGSRVRQRWLSAAAAAAVLALVAVATAVVYDTGTGRDATAAVHQAVEATIALSDSAISTTTVTFDFDDFAEPWVVNVDATFSDGNVEYRVTPGPAMEQAGIPQMDPYAEVIVNGQAYRSVGDAPWDGPTPVASDGPQGSAIESNLTFGVAIDDLGDLYDFVDLGRADLDGVAVAHYRTDETPAGAGAGMLISLGMIMMAANQGPISGPERVQLDVWVDSDDLIRRVSYSAVIEDTGSFGVVTEWGSFGQAPPITAPAN